jgi:hypothetical protein
MVLEYDDSNEGIDRPKQLASFQRLRWCAECACWFDYEHGCPSQIREVTKVERDEALALLKDLEWKDAGSAGKVCVVCDGWYSHEPGCRLAKLLCEEPHTP